MTKQREHLVSYTEAAKQIELAGVCINVLESMRGLVALRCIAALRRVQQEALIELDANAARLGAPYPKATS